MRDPAAWIIGIWFVYLSHALSFAACRPNLFSGPSCLSEISLHPPSSIPPITRQTNPSIKICECSYSFADYFVIVFNERFCFWVDFRFNMHKTRRLVARRVRIMKLKSLIAETSKRLEGLNRLLAEERSHLKSLMKNIANLEKFRYEDPQILTRFPLLLFYINKILFSIYITTH